MPFLFTPRRFALVTALSAVLLAWALAERSEVAVPLSAVLVLAAFGWSLARMHAEAVGPVPAVCAGCRAGCVECRERIDLPA